MAFDGITVAALCSEFDKTLTGGRIAKIIQPESDEIILTIKNNSSQYRLLLSANASLPLACLIQQNKQAPMTAPNFCMLLRKHVGGGKITAIEQPGLERILIFHIEHRNELGDLCSKKLIIELMGKHSNLIFTDDRGIIIDAIKRVPVFVSSVREVLPGREYFIPETQQKQNPLTLSSTAFAELLQTDQFPLYQIFYRSLTGLSPLIGEELCERAGLSTENIPSALSELEREHLWHTFSSMMEEVRNHHFEPTLYSTEDGPFEFSPFPLKTCQSATEKDFDSMSVLINYFYAEREIKTRIRQKSADLRKVITNLVERTGKKLALQQKQMKDTEKREKLRIYGELLHTYGYQATLGDTSLSAVNYYTNEEITIPLDPTLTAAENAKKYFDRYTKLKRTAEALTDQIAESEYQLQHLQSIAQSLELSTCEADLSQIRRELSESGYVKKKITGNGKNQRQPKEQSQPLHYISSDGFDIYVGKNNFQNEEVSFKIGSGNDWWFHAKGVPGSHVIVKGDGKELPDRTFEEAGSLAGFYSKNRLAPKVEIDYTLRKNLKKPAGAHPGFVVYYTNYSLVAIPDISEIKQLDI